MKDSVLKDNCKCLKTAIKGLTFKDDMETFCKFRHRYLQILRHPLANHHKIINALTIWFIDCLFIYLQMFNVFDCKCITL